MGMRRVRDGSSAQRAISLQGVFSGLFRTEARARYRQDRGCRALPAFGRSRAEIHRPAQGLSPRHHPRSRHLPSAHACHPAARAEAQNSHCIQPARLQDHLPGLSLLQTRDRRLRAMPWRTPVELRRAPLRARLVRGRCRLCPRWFDTMASRLDPRYRLGLHRPLPFHCRQIRRARNRARQIALCAQFFRDHG